MYINIDHDVWRYLVRQKGVPSEHKGYFLYQKTDFDRFATLSAHWDYCLDAHGQGVTIDFPLKAKPALSWTADHYFTEQGKLKLAPKIVIEKVHIVFAKKACDVNNIA